MTKNDIFEVVRKNVIDVMFSIEEQRITPDESLRNLGANSIDRATIVTQSLADLGVKMSLLHTVQAKNLGELVDLIHRHGISAGG